MRPKEEEKSVRQAQEFNMEQLVEMHLGFAPSRTLMAALDLNVFSKIYEGHKTAERIAGACGASDRGMRMLLDALASLRILDKTRGGHYSLPAFVAQFLVRESPDYLGDFLNIDTIWQAWGGLTESVRTGKPFRTVEHQREAEEFFPKLVRGLHVVNRQPAQNLARALAGTIPPNPQILDVAAGSGVWGIAFAEADPQTRVTAQDFPGMIPVTRSYVERHRVAGQYDYLLGDLRTVDFGHDRFDVAILGNIVHSEGVESSRDLFRRIHRALRRDGHVAIIDMVPDNERTGPVFPLIFALNMLVNTEQGGTYTLEEYREWLTGAGFRRVEARDIEFHSPVIIGRK
jgi:ubiquinone/menaquinone biosynthesis C-methylase UbiE